MLRACSCSLTHSAMMSLAPCKASSVLFTSPCTNFFALLTGDSPVCSINRFAKGSNPLRRAISARVTRFGL